jgi:alpha-galactosidase
VIHFGGAGWADEWAWVPERLTTGLKVLESLGGVQPHLQRCPMLLVEPNGPATETAGDTVAFSIAWGGNTRFELDVRPLPGHALRSLRLTAGANGHGPHTGSPIRERRSNAWRLVDWSSHGRGSATDRFHRYTRRHALRDGSGRSIVANNWEATAFD